MTIPGTTHRPDVYDMAVLAGGLPRLVDTVLVAMVESGRVHVEPSGEFHADAASSPHPVEAAMLDAVGISLVDGDPAWKQQVRDRLRPFCAAVASAHAIAAE